MRTSNAVRSRLYGVILAGGRGTRFWPRSRRRFPKQLLSFWEGRSLLQQTVDRLRPLIPPERIWVFTNEWLAKEVKRQLPQVPASQVIAEPVQRNTGPCAGLASEIILAEDPEAILGLFPSDQTIREPKTYLRVLEIAAAEAAKGSIVVLGIAPRWPETGYGYMEFAARPSHRNVRAIPVKRFREKPPLEVARRYVRSGRFFWNSGMFFWKAKTLQQALREHLPKTAAVLAQISRRLGAKKRRSGMLQNVLRELYPACKNISVDYAVLEKAAGVMGIPCDFGWSDVGSWNAVYDLLPKDAAGNVLRTPALLRDCEGLLIDAPGKLVAGIGLRDVVVVETPDALLIARRDRAQEVAHLVQELESLHREDLL